VIQPGTLTRPLPQSDVAVVKLAEGTTFILRSGSPGCWATLRMDDGRNVQLDIHALPGQIDRVITQAQTSAGTCEVRCEVRQSIRVASYSAVQVTGTGSGLYQTADGRALRASGCSENAAGASALLYVLPGEAGAHLLFENGADCLVSPARAMSRAA
jgi:hypothetical protein